MKGHHRRVVALSFAKRASELDAASELMWLSRNPFFPYLEEHLRAWPRGENFG